MSTALGRDDIILLLDDLNDELRGCGAHADLFLVGGAAIAVAYDSARSARDLDAVFLPTSRCPFRFRRTVAGTGPAR